jgi:hypothetical protein
MKGLILTLVLVFTVGLSSTALASETRSRVWQLENGGNASVSASMTVPYYTYHANHAGGLSSAGAPGSTGTVSCRVFAIYTDITSYSWDNYNDGLRCRRTVPAYWPLGWYTGIFDFRLTLSQSRFSCAGCFVSNPGYMNWEIGTEGRVVKGTIWVRG